MHVDSLRAGADVISTASYQASREAFATAGLGADEADALLAGSVALARDACAQCGVTRELPPLVAASLGPWGAMLADGSEYRGDSVVPAQQLSDFHRRRVEAVLRGRPDLVLFETIPSLAEGAALAAVAAALPEVPFMVSFSATSAAGIAHGEPFADAVRLFWARPTSSPWASTARRRPPSRRCSRPCRRPTRCSRRRPTAARAGTPPAAGGPAPPRAPSPSGLPATSRPARASSAAAAAPAPPTSPPPAARWPCLR